MKLLSLTTLATLLMFCSASSTREEHRTPMSPTPLSSTHGMSIMYLTLQAREQQNLPVGQLPTDNRDIGFATVFLKIENQQLKNVELIVKSIQIQDVTTGEIELATQTPVAILLRPLEHSVNDFHLTNRTGYQTQELVKAVVTYQIDEQEQVIESAPVEIERL